jgi:hypothetical protein
MNTTTLKGRIAQLVDKVDILRAQIAGMKALAREAGTDPGEAAKPYVDMLLALLDADLAGALAECKPARAVTGPSPVGEESAAGECVDIEGTMRSLDLDGRRFILRDGDRTNIFHFDEAHEADVAALFGQRVRVNCVARTIEVPRTIYTVKSITPL